MSGGILDDEDCQDNSRESPCTTGSCNRPIVRDFALADKPLPSPPLIDVINNELQEYERGSLGRFRARSLILGEGETVEEAQKAMVPPPLNIGRKCAQNLVRRTRSLSPLVEHSEGPTRLHAEQPPILPPRQKRFGSVRNARLAAEAHLVAAGSRPALRHGPLRSTVSTNSLRSPSPRLWQSAVATPPSEVAFVNPRQAPSPPYEIVNLGPRKEFHKTTAQPGNVARARAAAVEALHAKKSRGSPRSSGSSCEAESSRLTGSVRRPREKLGQPGSGRAALENLPTSRVDFATRSCSLPRASAYKLRENVRGERTNISRPSRDVEPESVNDETILEGLSSSSRWSEDSSPVSRYQPPRCDDEEGGGGGGETYEDFPPRRRSSTDPDDLRRVDIPPPDNSILVTKQTSITHHQPSCLRGGGSDSSDSSANSSSSSSSDSLNGYSTRIVSPWSPLVPASFTRPTPSERLHG
jgi:hypothetical protein